MEHRFAGDGDIARLAAWNAQLIADEGHRNAMTVAQLGDRMAAWLADAYRAVVFERDGCPVAYALYCEAVTEVRLRQFFVDRGHRRRGVGRRAVGLLRSVVWPRHKRIVVEALTANAPAVAFWRSVGFRDYSLALEVLPDASGEVRGSSDAAPSAAAPVRP